MALSVWPILDYISTVSHLAYGFMITITNDSLASLKVFSPT
jgi:hypothetical protein